MKTLKVYSKENKEVILTYGIDVYYPYFFILRI